MKIKILSVLVFAACLESAKAQTTVTGTLLNITGQTNATYIEFIPQTTVLIQANGLSSGPAMTLWATNGTFSITLNPENYTVAFPLVPGRIPIQIVVPPNAGTVNITNLISTTPAYAYAFNGGTASNSLYSITSGVAGAVSGIITNNTTGNAASATTATSVTNSTGTGSSVSTNFAGAVNLKNLANSFAGNGAALSLHTNYTAIYCDLSGSDTNSGLDINHPVLTPTNAIAKAAALGIFQPTIYIGNGVYNLTSEYLDATNITILGITAGILNKIGAATGLLLSTNGTVISMDGNSAINAGNNCDVENLNIFQNTGGHHPLSTIGGLNSQDGDHNIANWSTLTTTNCVIRNCTINGIFVHTFVSSSTNSVNITLDHDKLFTGYDGDVISFNNNGTETSGLATNPVSQILTMNDCIVESGTNLTGGVYDTIYIGNASIFTFTGGSIIRDAGLTNNDQDNLICIDGTNVTANINPDISGSPSNSQSIYFPATANNDNVNVGFGICQTNIVNLGTSCTVSNFGNEYLSPASISSLLKTNGNGSSLTSIPLSGVNGGAVFWQTFQYGILLLNTNGNAATDIILGNKVDSNADFNSIGIGDLTLQAGKANGSYLTNLNLKAQTTIVWSNLDVSGFFVATNVPTLVKTNTAPVSTTVPVIWFGVSNGTSFYEIPGYQ